MKRVSEHGILYDLMGWYRSRSVGGGQRCVSQAGRQQAGEGRQ